MTQEKIGFNKAISELERILAQIESGELDVDKLSGEVKRASELIKICQKKLRETEQDVNKIIDELE